MTREPRFRGCGIYMPMQPIPDLVIGDTCWDADAGKLIWNGEKWLNDSDKYVELYNKILN